MIIGLGHRKRKGKDTVARMLLDLAMENGMTCQRIAFADKVKEAAQKMWGWAGLMDASYYEENPEAREIVLPAIGKAPRELWIQLGMWARTICPYTWVNAALDGAENYDLAVVTDVRFPNEVEVLRNMNALLIRVDRDNVPNDPNPADEALAGYLDWDVVIHNDSSLDLLFAVVKNIWEGYCASDKYES